VIELLKRLGCAIFGHRLYVVQEFRPVSRGASASRRVGCRCCDGDWGMHDETRSFVPWGPDIEKMYEATGRRVLKR
jgi:hypothetical protein